MSSDEDRRHSEAEEPSLISDPQAKAEAEARNGLRQFDLGVQIIEDGIAKGAGFRLRPSVILALHRAALEGLSQYAGNWRPASVGIHGSKHEPIGAHLVAEAIEEMCDYINDNWRDQTALHLASYVMWRLNWIHPFSDGNGRTSRITSYVVLSVKLGLVLPGAKTIPEQIVDKRGPYFAALEAADQAFKAGEIDLSVMEALLEQLLAVQLGKVLDSASGKNRF
ncbi:Fic family protein [Phreatobacter stygius]|uniref:Fic family protein n=1 Tax=Phreatobacter stygius TaxID=1940610 RepID=A0A4D7B4A9_9HYPH|nr:Fic family protein [Phreatobacter stygius]QCI64516.1 Fic family protein [Phreatobacter stygius]